MEGQNQAELPSVRERKIDPADLHYEVLYVDNLKISCDGGGGALGHPLVYFELVDGSATCPYCSRYYMHKDYKTV